MFTENIAKKSDLHTIHALAKQIWEPTYGEILSKEQLDYMFEMMYSLESLERQLTELNHVFYIFYHNDNPVGYICVEQKGGSYFNLQKIYALPSIQGKGLGKYMVRVAIEHSGKLSNAHPFTLELCVNRKNKAVEFYKHLGFVVIDERDFNIGNDYYMNDYIMALICG